MADKNISMDKPIETDFDFMLNSGTAKWTVELAFGYMVLGLFNDINKFRRDGDIAQAYGTMQMIYRALLPRVDKKNQEEFIQLKESIAKKMINYDTLFRTNNKTELFLVHEELEKFEITLHSAAYGLGITHSKTKNPFWSMTDVK